MSRCAASLNAQRKPACNRTYSNVFDWLFVLVTGAIAWHGLAYRDENGESEVGHLLFGAIALLFCLRVLFVDILDLV